MYGKILNSMIALLIAGFYTFANAQAYSSQQENLRLLDRLERVERDMETVQKQVYREQVSLNNDEDQSGEMVVSHNGAALEVRMSEIEEQMRALNGKIEQAEFATNQLTEQLTKLSGDLEFRLEEIEKTLTAEPKLLSSKSSPKERSLEKGIASSSQKSEKPAVQEAGPVKKEMPRSLGTIPVELKEPTLEEELVLTEDTETVAKETKGVEEPEALYDEAYALLQGGDYNQAIATFKKYITNYPKHRLVGQAYYWTGESYFAQKNYQNAGVNFLKSYKQFPKGAKAPESLLKLGMSLGHLKKKKDACKMHQRLIREYPKASSVIQQRAEQEMKRLSCIKQ